MESLDCDVTKTPNRLTDGGEVVSLMRRIMEPNLMESVDCDVTNNTETVRTSHIVVAYRMHVLGSIPSETGI
jgi:hypothetical protein